MITCKIDLQSPELKISREFCTFKLHSLDALITTIEAKINDLILCSRSKLPETNIHIHFVNQDDIHLMVTRYAHKLVQFISSQEKLLLRVFFKTDAHLDRSQLNIIGQQCEQAFLQALKKKFKTPKSSERFALVERFAQGLPSPSLNKSILISEAILPLPILGIRDTALPLVEPVTIPSVARPALDNLSDDPFFRPLSDILEQISADRRFIIVHAVGKDGLKFLCKQLKAIFSVEQFSYIYLRFFQTEAQAQQLFLLFMPSGALYLKCLSTWPKTLLDYWIGWLRQDTISNLAFTDAVQYMQDFWVTIKDFYPTIPSPGAMSEYNYLARLNAMKDLINQVRSPFKKFQAEALFGLKESVLTHYADILNRTGAQWICQNMFALNASVLKKYTLHKQLVESTEAAYYQFSTQHLQDTTETAVNVFEYSQFVKELSEGDQAQAWQWAAWCVSLPKLFHKQDFVKIYREFEKLSAGSMLVLYNFLFALPIERRLNVATWEKLFAIIKGNTNLLVKAVQFYDVWQQMVPRAHLNSWETILQYLILCQDQAKIDFVLSLSSRSDLSFEQLYYQALLALFIEHSETNLELLGSLSLTFNTYPMVLKENLIAVLSSYQAGERALNLTGLRLAIASLQANEPMEAAFSSHLSGFSFNYFKSVIDYELVLNKMGALFASVEKGLDFFLSGKRFMPFPVPPVKSLLLGEAVTVLSNQQRGLEAIKTELEYLKNLKTGIDVTSLFERFKVVDNFFQAFVTRRLGVTFTGSLFRLLPRLDKNLNTETTIKGLVEVLYKNHDYIPTSIATALPKDILKILHETSSETPLMQKFLKIYLVDDLVKNLENELDRKLRISVIPVVERKKLAQFLAELPLESQALLDFFTRYQAILLVIKAWPNLETELLEITSPEIVSGIWKVLLDEQLNTMGDPFSSTYWHLALRLLREWVASARTRPAIRACSLNHLCAAFFKAKSGLKSVGVAANGELRHKHLDILFENIFIAILKFWQNPYFLHLLPQAIESILETGTPYDFEKNLQSFAALGGNQQLLQRLMGFGSHPEQRKHVENILASFSTAIDKEKVTGKPWGMLFNQILNFSDLEMHLSKINPVLQWLFKHEDFPWLQMILDDKQASASQLVELVRLMKTDNILVKAYLQSYGPPLTPVIQVKPADSVKVPRAWFSGFFKWFSSQPEPCPPIPQAELVEKIPDYIQQAWKLWKKPSYPSLAKFNHWITLGSKQFLQAQDEFDRYPLGPLLTYTVSDDEIRNWMRELLLYDYFAPDKNKMESRLRKLLLATNQAFSEKRTGLKDKFVAYKKLNRELSSDEQDDLLAVVVALYYKITNRKPYPPQLLILLINLVYKNKNLVLEVDTGEGKGIVTALLAVLKWSLRSNATVEIRTANRDLVRQDYLEKGHWRLFEFLDIPSGMIQENSRPDTYQPGGIYYGTQQDLMVFKELYRLQCPQQKLPEDIDVIVDEIDHVVLDQTSMINLSRKSQDSQDLLWFYRSINQFIDEQMGRVDKPKHALKKWAGLLKQFLHNSFRNDPRRIAWINQYALDKWSDWVELAIYAKSLRENEHFIVEAIEDGRSRYFQVVPYMNHEIKHGYELSYQSKSGLTQLLHARLNTELRHFKVEPEDQMMMKLPPADFRRVHSFIGLSGSIGALSECYELKETLGASMVRICRQHASRLKELPLVLSANQELLYQTLRQNIAAENNPILVCFPEIEDASRFHDFLVKQFNGRPIRLLTGQESHIERRAWLHPNTNAEYAGSPYAITVATLICGRGTDIVVEARHFLSILQVGVLEPRSMVQLKGRTARNNQKGHYQVYINQQQVPEGIDNSQYGLIVQHRDKRLQLRLKLWLNWALCEHLGPILAPLSQIQKNEYLFQATSELEKLAIIQSLNVSECIEPVVDIMTNILARLRVAGLIAGTKQESTLRHFLKAHKDEWVCMVIPREVAVPTVAPRLSMDTEFSASELKNFKHSLALQIPQKSSSKWFGWLYDNDPLTVHNLKILEDTWQNFSMNPNMEYWTSFYQVLQSAQEYSVLQNSQSSWFKWMKLKSDLTLWGKVTRYADFLIQSNKIFSEKSGYFYKSVLTKINEKLDTNLIPQGVWSYFYKVFYFIFSFFNSKMADLEQGLRVKHQAFKDNPSQENMKAFWKALYELFECCQSSGFWSLTHWLFWNRHCKTYLELYRDLPKWLENDTQLGSKAQLWQQQQSTIGHFQLMFRTQLTRQLEHYQDGWGLKGFWTKSQVDYVAREQKYLGDLQTQSISSKVRVNLELDELVRAYPKEIQFLYGKLPGNSDLNEGREKTLRWMLLALFQAKFKPLSVKFSLDIQSGRLKAFITELQKWENCRELLGEWDRMNLSLS